MQKELLAAVKHFLISCLVQSRHTKTANQMVKDKLLLYLLIRIRIHVQTSMISVNEWTKAYKRQTTHSLES